MSDYDDQSQIVNTSNNMTYGYDEGHASVLQLRLDTSETLEKFELFLRASRDQFLQDTKTGKGRTHRIKFGQPLANDEGVQTMLSYLTAIINTQTVQGNFTEEEYKHYVWEAHIELTTMIILNCNKWQIQEGNISSIISAATKIIWPYMSRPKNNGERNSFAVSLRSEERNVVQNPVKQGIMSRIPFVGNRFKGQGQENN